MSQLNAFPYSLLQFYSTAAYPCSYLPERTARSQVATPCHIIDTGLYAELVRNGFRRSGIFTYRPWCDCCSACVPVRVPVDRFTRDRSQERAWRRHSTLQARERSLVFEEEHYQVYRRYQDARHAGGGMDQDGRDQYAHFLLQSQVDTRLIEFRDAGQLRMVSIIDCLNDGLSSVYTFYDPAVRQSSFGTYSILWQIEATRQTAHPYVYLGYWIRDSSKMQYKQRFRPLEGRVAGHWRELHEEDFNSLG